MSIWRRLRYLLPFYRRAEEREMQEEFDALTADRKSTRLNSSHSQISYAVFCLKKKAACYSGEKALGGALALKSEPGRPATLGSSAAAGVRLIVWCRDCRHQVEPDPAEQAQRYGAEMTLPDWCERLVCSKCGSREIDMGGTGTTRRAELARQQAFGLVGQQQVQPDDVPLG